MTRATLAPTAEIEAALAQHRLRPRSIVLVSPLLEKKGRRLAYRLENEDGRTVKVRQFENEDAARSVFELRAGMEESFAPALARHGCVLVEAWIDGVPFAEVDSETRAEEAGALLGRLHARPLPAGSPALVRTEEWRRGAESDLAILAEAERLSPGEVSRLRDELCQRDPSSAAATVVHLDFCADNMVIDRRGKLRIIDNEQLAIETPGLDLGLTFYRWPMPAAVWKSFGRGYQSSAPTLPTSNGFWRIVAASVGARVLLHRSPKRAELPLGLLRRFATGEDLSDRLWK